MGVQDSGSRRRGQEGIIRSQRSQDTIRRYEAGYGGQVKPGRTKGEIPRGTLHSGLEREQKVSLRGLELVMES